MPVLSNYTIMADQKGKEIKIAKPSSDILLLLQKYLEDTPLYTFKENPFTLIRENEIRILQNATELFAWLQTLGIDTVWKNGEGAVTKEEFYKYLVLMLRQYKMTSSLPHSPKIKDIFYSPWKLKSKDKTEGKLDALIELFNPATSHDKSLIKAAFLTPLWGGEPGKRPALIIEGDGEDNGRGIGKTELMDTIIEIAGGAIDCLIPHRVDDTEGIKKRLFGAGQARCVRFDNVKSHKVSSTGMEGLITSPIISGHKMYIGETVIQNYFTYILTMNDSNLSSDMAQRSIRIKLKRAEYEQGWQAKKDRMLKQNAEAIRSDIIHQLNEQVCANKNKVLRFSSWQNEVLNRVDPNPEISELIYQRQIEVDADAEEHAILWEFFAEKISTYRHEASGILVYGDADKYPYLVPRNVAAIWYKEAMGVYQCSQRTASINIKSIKRIKEHKIEGTRYWLFTPKTFSWDGAFQIDSQYSMMVNYHKFRMVKDKECNKVEELNPVDDSPLMP